MGRNDRPEHSAPPEIFYNDDEARKYTDNSRIINIQRQLTERALELLALPNDGSPKFLLDLGCGSGLSGEALTDQGHIWMVGWLFFFD
jgi:18S rRNA (guanine1575-N7)-methyltransferase